MQTTQTTAPPALDVTANHGVPFRVVLLPDGMSASRPQANRFADGRPLVEFYDARYPFTPDGQFVGCYYASTLLADRPGAAGAAGLCLAGDVPDWRIDAENMTAVRQWIAAQLES
jgi:hypothetical protein